MLAGRPPFLAKNVKDLRAAHIGEQPAFPADVPPVAQEIVLRCMAKSADARPQSAAALHDEIQDGIAVLSGERKRRGPRRHGVPAEPVAFLGHQSRAAADAAVLRLPVFAAVKAKLEEALAAAAPITLFHGPRPEVLNAVQRSVVDVNGTRRFYVAARTMLNAQSGTLGARLVEQLHLGSWPLPAWHDRVCAELTPEAGAGGTSGGPLPSVMELDLRRPLTSAEATDLIELGRRAEGKSIIFLVICDDATAEALRHELEASGFAFLVRHVQMRELTDEQRAEYVRTWTAQATGERLRWTDDALRFLRHQETAARKPAARLIHNAIMIAHGAGTRLVTTWSVLAAEQQPDYLQTVNDIPMTWRSRPQRWPADDLLPLLIGLRGGGEDEVDIEVD
jgi:hypothetical protein